MTTTEAPEVLSVDDRRLEKTQELREKIIDVLTESDMDIRANAKDKDLAKILLVTMKDSDDQILKRKKLIAEEKSTETNAALVAQIARQMAEDNIKRTGSSDYLSSNKDVGSIPTPDASRFGGSEPKPGEMDQEENNTDVDSFMSTHSKASRKANEINNSVNEQLEQ